MIRPAILALSLAVPLAGCYGSPTEPNEPRASLALASGPSPVQGSPFHPRVRPNFPSLSDSFAVSAACDTQATPAPIWLVRNIGPDMGSDARWSIGSLAGDSVDSGPVNLPAGALAQIRSSVPLSSGTWTLTLSWRGLSARYAYSCDAVNPPPGPGI